MHPSGCTALASARAHHICIFLYSGCLVSSSSTLVFRPATPFSRFSLSLLTHSFFFSFPQSPYFHRHDVATLYLYPLLRFLTLLNDMYTVRPLIRFLHAYRGASSSLSLRPSFSRSSSFQPTILVSFLSPSSHFYTHKGI